MRSTIPAESTVNASTSARTELGVLGTGVDASSADYPGVGRLMLGLTVVSACLGSMLLSADLSSRAIGFLGIVALAIIPRAALEVGTKTTWTRFCERRQGVVFRLVAISTGVPIVVCFAAVILR